MEEAIGRLASEEGVVGEEEGERVAAIKEAFQADKDKLTKIKTLLVRRVWLGKGSFHVKSAQKNYTPSSNLMR